MERQLKTIILAAGKGTRFNSRVPKVLHEVCGKPVLDYVIDTAKAAGSLKTYVVVGHEAELVRRAVEGRADIVLQEEQLGTAHAVRCAADEFKAYSGEVLVMCGDTPLLDPVIVRKLVSRHRRSGAVCTFLTAELANPEGYGRILRDESGRVRAIREHKDADTSERAIREINVGVYCFAGKELFGSIADIAINPKKKEFYLTDIIELFLSRGCKVDTLVTDDWTANLGINTRADLALAGSIMRERILKDLMSSGVTVVDPATTYVESDVRIGRDSVIYPCTYIHHGVRVGENCSVGPFARLRPGTVLADRVSVGNFAEISRSRLGADVNMKHFSFLGDADVGSGANIGCGAVTANYDGKNKNKTNIGRGAFIGCDAVLVAPTEVGAGAVVGAGSVVTPGRKVPANRVAVGIPARVIKKVERHE
jgi:bifunctional UDP-N-acetylglucosamine pyrophosphorylase/glucosamine-1-phosphate N-acetyltransferase